MARITIEDCLERVENRYELVHLATKRVKQLREGAEPLVKSKNKEVVTALREIAAGKITRDILNQPEHNFATSSLDLALSGDHGF